MKPESEPETESEPEPAPEDVLVVGTAEWTGRLAARLRSGGATVRTASTRTAATSALGSDPFDCVVTGDALEEGTALDVVTAVGDAPASPPVVVCTDRGSEALAGEALAAGASDYVPLAGPEAIDDAVARIARAADDRERRSDRARQFDALFEDERTATWVLGPDGAVERINRTARTLVGREGEPTTGTPFWSGPWWSHDDRVAADVRQVVRRAAAEGTTGRVVTEAAAGSDTRTVELAIHPVADSGDDPGSLVVRGVDVSERASLHRELRASERLHRVTLNSMTDTVLVTDDDGEFAYVCPNVNFVFGYSDEEVYDLGSIDELLGEDFFDRETLAEEGVLTNVECAATDADGEEHTLLVNVREVDIGGGSILYSCRDITERKRREEAMRALQTTTRELLYAESEAEIGRTVVGDAADILETESAALYLFRTEEGVLEPAAASGAFAAGEGSPPSIRVGDGTLAGHAFIEGESAFVDERGVDAGPEGVESVAYIPLGERGVLATGATEADAFDDMGRELADLVAATAEAALERVERENQLREQDRKLQRRNRELTRLDRINELIRGVDRALVRAETREEIDRAVCETLTGSDRYRFAWVGAVDTPTGAVQPRAWAGEESGYLDSVNLAAEDDAEPAGRAAATGTTTMVPNVAAALRRAPWRKEALAREFHSVISVPLVYDEFVYGVLTVYADETEAFDEGSREIFTELGRTVGAAISALERKNALLTASRTRLEFESRDESFVLLRLARRAGAALSFRGGVQQTGDGVALFVSVAEAPVSDLVATARETVAVDGVRVLNENGGEGLVRLQLSGSFVALSLADRGAVLRRIDVDEESATVVVDAPGSIDTASVVRHVTETFAETELVAKRTDDRTGSGDLYSTFLDRLTDRQLEVVQAAYYGGFFESPRENTGEEVAEALGISPPAFYRHNRTVQRKLFSTLFDDIGVPADGSV